jgi:hypothetical protein
VVRHWWNSSYYNMMFASRTTPFLPSIEADDRASIEGSMRKINLLKVVVFAELEWLKPLSSVTLNTRMSVSVGRIVYAARCVSIHFLCVSLLLWMAGKHDYTVSQGWPTSTYWRATIRKHSFEFECGLRENLLHELTFCPRAYVTFCPYGPYLLADLRASRCIRYPHNDFQRLWGSWESMRRKTYFLLKGVNETLPVFLDCDKIFYKKWPRGLR